MGRRPFRNAQHQAVLHIGSQPAAEVEAGVCGIQRVGERLARQQGLRKRQLVLMQHTQARRIALPPDQRCLRNALLQQFERGIQTALAFVGQCDGGGSVSAGQRAGARCQAEHTAPGSRSARVAKLDAS